MKSTGLAARVTYAILAVPAALAVGFCATAWLLPRVAPILGIASPPPQSEDLFRLALSIGAIFAVPVFFCALTLPWKRRRQRSGRNWRLAMSAVIVVVASLAFAGLGHSLRYDLLFAVWLAYTMALTFVRYGLVDRKRERVYATEPDDD